ncbi:MAG TPA: polysaccharide deacetylase family protein [Puia sp.]|nr:polysaccharide deacetylase family protein [Puia sp.]
MFYFVKTPWLLKKCYPGCLWNMPRSEKKIYLTFDDGPHPEATPFVLEQLAKYNAKATFFCIGKNVQEYPEVYKRILEAGHLTGNHTHNHLNGWQVTDREYFENIRLAKKYIDSNLFRPPYGRISRFQLKALTDSANFKVVMWDVLSADFDREVTAEKCASIVRKYSEEGSIVIFHDSEKAMQRMQHALPETLDYFTKKGFRFETLDY